MKYLNKVNNVLLVGVPLLIVTWPGFALLPFTLPNAIWFFAAVSLMAFSVIKGLQLLMRSQNIPQPSATKEQLKDLECSIERETKDLQALEKRLEDKTLSAGDRKILIDDIARMQSQVALACLEERVKRTGDYAGEIAKQNAKEEALLKEIRVIDRRLKNNTLSAAKKTELMAHLRRLEKQHDFATNCLLKLNHLKKQSEMPKNGKPGKDAFTAAIERMTTNKTAPVTTVFNNMQKRTTKETASNIHSDEVKNRTRKKAG